MKKIFTAQIRSQMHCYGNGAELFFTVYRVKHRTLFIHNHIYRRST